MGLERGFGEGGTVDASSPESILREQAGSAVYPGAASAEGLAAPMTEPKR